MKSKHLAAVLALLAALIGAASVPATPDTVTDAYEKFLVPLRP